MDEQRLYQTLKQQFGFDEFRPGQKETIQAVLNQNDVLAVLPTGAGKTLLYQQLPRRGFKMIFSKKWGLMKKTSGG